MHAPAGVKHTVPRAAFAPASQRLSSQVLTLTDAGRDLYGPGYRALIKQHKHAVAPGVRRGAIRCFDQRESMGADYIPRGRYDALPPAQLLQAHAPAHEHLLPKLVMLQSNHVNYAISSDLGQSCWSMSAQTDVCPHLLSARLHTEANSVRQTDVAAVLLA